MPIFSCSAEEARKRLETSSNSRWFNHGSDLKLYMEEEGDERSNLAATRMDNAVFYPVVSPKHKIQLFDRLFSIGSCFARGIEWALRGRGLDVLSHKLFFDAIHHNTLPFRNAGGNNKYNTNCMLQELQWALEPEKFVLPTEIAIEGKDGQFSDSQAHCHIFGTKKEILEAHELYMTEVFREIAKCQCIIFTLGLTEVWFDTMTDTYMNTTPTIDQINRWPQRFTFEIMTFDENIQNLESVYELIQKHCTADVKVFISVSPVPLAATFSGNDIVSANMYSKSILRAVAETWARKYENVEYLPTYEMVLSSERNAAWENDYCHIRKDFFKEISNWFCDYYIELESKEKLSSSAACYLGGKKVSDKETYSLIEERLAIFANPSYSHLEFSG